MATHRRKGSPRVGGQQAFSAKEIRALGDARRAPAGLHLHGPKPRLEELVWVRFRTTRRFDCARCYEPTSAGQWAYRVAHRTEGGQPHSATMCGRYLCHWCGEKLAGKMGETTAEPAEGAEKKDQPRTR